LLGATLAVPRGKDVGGSFQHIPVCLTPSQTGCVISYVSFRSTMPPPANTRFGKVADERLVPVCTNPAALGGGSGDLHAYLSREGRTITGRRCHDRGRAGAADRDTVDHGAGALKARCTSNEHATYLEVTVHGDPSDPRTDDIVTIQRKRSGAARLGSHLVDVNLAMGNLVDIVGRQAKA
jgi:hypothetical protein